MLCSMRGTKIAGVEGLWLVSRPNCSVSESPDDSPEVWVCSPFIVPSQNSMRDHCDVISWCHNHLLWSSGGKTTVHVHRKHHSSSAHLLASMPESPVTIDASKPLHLFLNLNSMPVTSISSVSALLCPGSKQFCNHHLFLSLFSCSHTAISPLARPCILLVCCPLSLCPFSKLLFPKTINMSVDMICLPLYYWHCTFLGHHQKSQNMPCMTSRHHDIMKDIVPLQYTCQITIFRTSQLGQRCYNSINL